MKKGHRILCQACSPYCGDNCVAEKKCQKCGAHLCDSCYAGDHGLGKHNCGG